LRCTIKTRVPRKDCGARRSQPNADLHVSMSQTCRAGGARGLEYDDDDDAPLPRSTASHTLRASGAEGEAEKAGSRGGDNRRERATGEAGADARRLAWDKRARLEHCPSPLLMHSSCMQHRVTWWLH
jgi:hypothetical protein